MDSKGFTSIWNTFRHHESDAMRWNALYHHLSGPFVSFKMTRLIFANHVLVKIRGQRIYALLMPYLPLVLPRSHGLWHGFSLSSKWSRIWRRVHTNRLYTLQYQHITMLYTFIYLYIPLYTFIYLYIPLYTLYVATCSHTLPPETCGIHSRQWNQMTAEISPSFPFAQDKNLAERNIKTIMTDILHSNE